MRWFHCAALGEVNPFTYTIAHDPAISHYAPVVRWRQKTPRLWGGYAGNDVPSSRERDTLTDQMSAFFKRGHTVTMCIA